MAIPPESTDPEQYSSVQEQDAHHAPTENRPTTELLPSAKEKIQEIIALGDDLLTELEEFLS